MTEFDKCLKDLIDARLERDLWKNLAERLDKLLVCYRLHKRPSDKLLNEISTLRLELKTFNTGER
jgi:hypothetical protein